MKKNNRKTKKKCTKKSHNFNLKDITRDVDIPTKNGRAAFNKTCGEETKIILKEGIITGMLVHGTLFIGIPKG